MKTLLAAIAAVFIMTSATVAFAQSGENDIAEGPTGPGYCEFLSGKERMKCFYNEDHNELTVESEGPDSPSSSGGGEAGDSNAAGE